MQKIAKNSFISAVIRGIITGVVALVILFFGLYGASVYAQNNPGGKFWEILDKILVKKWNDTSNDGAVKNAQKLGGVEAGAFIQKKNADQKCAENQCVAGFKSDGTIICH